MPPNSSENVEITSTLASSSQSEDIDATQANIDTHNQDTLPPAPSHILANSTSPSSGGRPTSQATAFVHQGFDRIHEQLVDLAKHEATTHDALLKRYNIWAADDAKVKRGFNIYQTYFNENLETESARLGIPYDGTRNFVSACWAAFKNSVPHWEQIMRTHEELKSTETSKSVGDRKKEVAKYAQQMERKVRYEYLLVCARYSLQ